MATAGVVHFSDFPTASNLTGSESLAGLQGGGNVVISPSQLLNFVLTTPGTLTNKTVSTATTGDSSGAVASTQFVATAIAPLAPKASPAFTGNASFGGASFAGAVTFTSRPSFNGATPWDSANFMPANYLTAANPTFTGMLSGPAAVLSGQMSAVTGTATPGVTIQANAAGSAQLGFANSAGTASFGTLATTSGGSLTWNGATVYTTANLTPTNYALLSGAAFTGAVSFTSRPSFNGATPWDSANFTPSSYLPLAGGQMSLPITFAGTNGGGVGNGALIGYYLDTSNLALRTPSVSGGIFFGGPNGTTGWGVINSSVASFSVPITVSGSTVWHTGNLPHPVVSWTGTDTDGNAHNLAFGWNSSHIVGSVDGNGFVAIMLDNSGVPFTGNLSMSGTISGGAITDTSDARIKSQLRPIDDACELLNRIKGYRGLKHGTPDLFVVAQELEIALPELVVDANEPFEGGAPLKSVKYNGLVPVLIEARRRDLERFEATFAALWQEIADLRGRLGAS